MGRNRKTGRKVGDSSRVSVSDFHATQGIGKGAAAGGLIGFCACWLYFGWWYWEGSELAGWFYGVIGGVIGLIVGGIIGMYWGKLGGRLLNRRR